MFIFLEIRAESLFHFEEHQQLNRNLGDCGIMYDNEHELVKGKMWKLPRAGLSIRQATLLGLAKIPKSDWDRRGSPCHSRPSQTRSSHRARRHPV